MNGVILAICAILGVGCIAVVTDLQPNQNEFLAGLSLAVFVACLLPWAVFVRRKAFNRQATTSQRWTRTIIILLLLALLAGPLLTTSYYVWLKVATPTDDWGGFGPAIGFWAIVWLSHCVGIGFCIIAFLIQLWRDQWRTILNSVAIGYQFLAFLMFLKIVT